MLVPSKKSYIEPGSAFTLPEGNPDFTVKDFWQWAFSDLQQNNIRGILAEFIIARALNIDLGLRLSWDDYDLITSDGIKIEVKCGAYLQNWNQAKHSELVFGGLCGQVWDEAEGRRGGTAKYRADIYIFAVQNALTHDEYNAMDLTQWEFYILSKKQLEEKNTKSISLNVVKRMVNSVLFTELADSIKSIIGNGQPLKGEYMKSQEILPICVYTILHTDKLNCIFNQGGSGVISENKNWATANKLLIEAKSKDITMKVLFAAAENTNDLIYYGDLDDIKIDKTSPDKIFTLYTISNLTPFSEPKPKKTSLIINSTGNQISGGHIRPYVICNTPDML